MAGEASEVTIFVKLGPLFLLVNRTAARKDKKRVSVCVGRNELTAVRLLRLLSIEGYDAVCILIERRQWLLSLNCVKRKLLCGSKMFVRHAEVPLNDTARNLNRPYP